MRCAGQVTNKQDSQANDPWIGSCFHECQFGQAKLGIVRESDGYMVRLLNGWVPAIQASQQFNHSTI